jgi:hypothetical protein
MNIQQHFDNFKEGKIFSIDEHSKNLTVDGADGKYSYTLLTGEGFYEDINRVDDIDGVHIRNLKTEQTLKLEPYPLGLTVGLYNWTICIKYHLMNYSTNVKSLFESLEVKTELDAITDKIDNI